VTPVYEDKAKFCVGQANSFSEAFRIALPLLYTSHTLFSLYMPFRYTNAIDFMTTP
jgi:hypothetical protein